jgi:hypothetical protein
MEESLQIAMLIDKVSTAALLGLGLAFLWRRYIAASDKMIGIMTEQIAGVVGALGQVRTALEVGLAGVNGKLEVHDQRLQDHDKRLAEHSRTLDRHAALIEVMHSAERSGLYTRPRVVGEEADRS